MRGVERDGDCYAWRSLARCETGIRWFIVGAEYMTYPLLAQRCADTKGVKT